MDTLIHADIFFFVTTIAVIVVGAALTVALISLVKVLSDVKKITEEVRDETALFREDLRNLRDDARREGFKLKHIVDFMTGWIRRRKPSRSKNSKNVK
jgi:hypothetical protein